MRLAEGSVDRGGAAESDWADATRRVLTRDLLLRAARAQPAESHALQFRALHLNLPLVGEVADGLHMDGAERAALEHVALDGLAQAMRLFDPFGEDEFADFAMAFVEHQIVSHLPPDVSRRRG
jgi:DNA-directed RNA polymerase specialized sigma subunit